MVCKYKFDVAIMLNMIICFLELDEANAQLRETRKGMILFVFRLLVSHVAPKFYWFSFIVLH